MNIQVLHTIDLRNLNEHQINRIKRAKQAGNKSYVHLLSSGKLLISWKFIRPNYRHDVIAVSRLQDINITG